MEHNDTVITPKQRFTAKHPCPICRGYDGQQRGVSKRCYGFLSDDGVWAHCTRPEHAGSLTAHDDSNTYAHRLTGDCKCGTRHDPTPMTANNQSSEHTYIIRDAQGKVVAKHKRIERGDDKTFVWLQPDGSPGLKGLPRDAVPLYGVHLLTQLPGEPVIVTEGEKAADALLQAGKLALGTVTGADGTPAVDVLRPLVGRAVYLWPDADDKGRRHMARIAARLVELDIEPYIIDWTDAPPKGDAYDFIAKCGSNGAVDLLIKDAKRAKAAKNHEECQTHLYDSLRESWQPSCAVLLEDVQPEAIEWLSRGRLARGKITVLDGDPGLGKSTAIVDWAARITRGLPLPDGQSLPPAGVVLLSAEDGLADTIRPRFEAAGADLSRVLAITGIPDGETERLPALPDDLPLIEQAIVEMDAVVLIIDPLMAYLSSQVNSHRDQDIRRALAPLAAMAERTGVAIIIVRHINKTSQTNALYRGGGSIGIIGAARFGLLVAADPDDPEKRILASTKCNLAQPPATLAFQLAAVPGTDVARVEWLGESHHTAKSVLTQPEDDDETGSASNAVQVLREILSGGPVSAKTVKAEARDAGISDRTLWRAKNSLGIVAKKTGFDSGWVWTLPKAATVAEECHTKTDGSLRHSWQPSQLEIATPRSEANLDHDGRRMLEVDACLSRGDIKGAGKAAGYIRGQKERHAAEEKIKAHEAMIA